MKNTLNEQEKLIQSKQKDFQNASIFVTKNAVNKLKGVMKSDNKENYFLRMSVEGGGCSGMTYKMDFDKKQKEFDKVFKIVGETSSTKWSAYFYNQNRSEAFQIVFDTATGIMKLKNKESGLLYFSCNKIGKHKLPKPKF